MQSIGTLLQRNFTIRDIMWAIFVICLVVTWRLDVRRLRLDVVRLKNSYLQRIWDANFEAEQAHESLLEFEQTGYPVESSRYRLALKANSARSQIDVQVGRELLALSYDRHP